MTGEPIRKCWGVDPDWKPRKLDQREWYSPVTLDPHERTSIYKRPRRTAPSVRPHTFRIEKPKLRRDAEFIHEAANWEVFAHLTHRHDVSPAVSFHNFTKYCRNVATKVVHGHVWVAWSMARQRMGRIHYHVLLGRYHENTEPLDEQELRHLWLYGEKTKVERVESCGAEVYLAKHETWDLNVACDRPRPCRRKHGCRLAPGSWPTFNENVLSL